MYACMYVVPYLASLMCRDGDTFLACSRRLQVESQQWYIDHANTPHECSFRTDARRRSLMCPPRRGSAPRAIVMNVRPMGSVLSKSRSSCGRPETVLPMPALVRIRATLIAEGAEPRSACCLRLCQKCNLNQKNRKLVLLSIKYCRSTTSLR